MGDKIAFFKFLDNLNCTVIPKMQIKSKEKGKTDISEIARRRKWFLRLFSLTFMEKLNRMSNIFMSSKRSLNQGLNYLQIIKMSKEKTKNWKIVRTSSSGHKITSGY